MSESCDFLIVGAGIVGLTVAWELRKRDPLVKITILEKVTDLEDLILIAVLKLAQN